MIMADTEEYTDREVAIGCGGAFLGAAATLAVIGYAAYKTYEAVANSDTKITLKIEEGAAEK